MSDTAADRNPSEVIDAFHDGIKDLSTDALEIHINAVRTGCIELLLELIRLVVDAGIKTVGSGDLAALIVGSGHADNPTP